MIQRSRAARDLPEIIAVSKEIQAKALQLGELVEWAQRLDQARGIGYPSRPGTTQRPVPEVGEDAELTGPLDGSQTERSLNHDGSLQRDPIANDMRKTRALLEMTLERLTWALQQAPLNLEAKPYEDLRRCKYGCPVVGPLRVQMCQAHYKRWDRAGRPEAWVPDTVIVAKEAAQRERDEAERRASRKAKRKGKAA